MLERSGPSPEEIEAGPEKASELGNQPGPAPEETGADEGKAQELYDKMREAEDEDTLAYRMQRAVENVRDDVTVAEALTQLSARIDADKDSILAGEKKAAELREKAAEAARGERWDELVERRSDSWPGKIDAAKLGVFMAKQRIETHQGIAHVLGEEPDGSVLMGTVKDRFSELRDAAIDKSSRAREAYHTADKAERAAKEAKAA